MYEPLESGSRWRPIVSKAINGPWLPFLLTFYGLNLHCQTYTGSGNNYRLNPQCKEKNPEFSTLHSELDPKTEKSIGFARNETNHLKLKEERELVSMTQITKNWELRLDIVAMTKIT